MKEKKIRKKPVLLSVVICTHNRQDDLINALNSLTGQITTRDDVELIIVDNQSSDGTADLLNQFCQGKHNIRSVYEEKIGLSNARNRGWREAVGAFVGYTDDDALLPDQWVKTALEIIRQSKYPLFGGPYIPFYKLEKPIWFKDAYGSSYWLPDEERVLTDRYLVGGNMFIRRDLLESYGGFSEKYGMSGSNLGYNEETNFQIRLLKSEPQTKIFFTPRLYIRHLVSDKKMQLSWPVKRYLKQGGDKFRSDKSNNLNPWNRLFLFNLAKIPVVLIIGFIDLGLLIIFRSRKKYPHWQNYIYENIKRYAYQIGYAASALGIQ